MRLKNIWDSNEERSLPVYSSSQFYGKYFPQTPRTLLVAETRGKLMKMKIRWRNLVARIECNCNTRTVHGAILWSQNYRTNHGSNRKTKTRNEEGRAKGSSGSWTLTRSCFSAIWVEAGAKQMVERNITETKRETCPTTLFNTASTHSDKNKKKIGSFYLGEFERSFSAFRSFFRDFVNENSSSKRSISPDLFSISCRVEATWVVRSGFFFYHGLIALVFWRAVL